METIAEAKVYLRDNFEKGVKCPCCNQTVKLYRRKLNSGMAFGLIKASRLGALEKFIHIPSVFTENGINTSNSEFSKLKYWGLVEEQLNDTTHKRNSGFWKITKKGRGFLLKELSIPKYVFIFDGRLINFPQEEKVFIDECLKDHFSYSELMNS